LFFIPGSILMSRQFESLFTPHLEVRQEALSGDSWRPRETTQARIFSSGRRADPEPARTHHIPVGLQLRIDLFIQKITVSGVIPEYKGEILYSPGFKGVSGGLIWFELKEEGVFFFDTTKKLTADEAYQWIFQEWEPLAYWEARGQTPRNTTVRILDASMCRYWLRNVRDQTVLSRKEGMLREGLSGRKIYALCLRAKARFMPTSFRIKTGNLVQGKLRIEGKNGRIVPFLLPTALSDAPEMKFRVGYCDQHYCKIVSVNPQQKGSLSFSVGALLSHAELDSRLPLEVVYVGQSRIIEDRLLRHEKIQYALARWGDDWDVVSLPMEFQEPSINLASPLPKMMEVIRTNTTHISEKKRLDLLEKALIAHFLPILNLLDKKPNIASKKSVATILKEQGYVKVTVAFEPVPEVLLWSSYRKISAAHIIEEDFANYEDLLKKAPEFDCFKGLFAESSPEADSASLQKVEEGVGIWGRFIKWLKLRCGMSLDF
jgi:hypothetical protein